MIGYWFAPVNLSKYINSVRQTAPSLATVQFTEVNLTNYHVSSLSRRKSAAASHRSSQTCTLTLHAGPSRRTILTVFTAVMKFMASSLTFSCSRPNLLSYRTRQMAEKQKKSINVGHYLNSKGLTLNRWYFDIVSIYRQCRAGFS